jgi:putative PEP-CTERM system TPR-repeat lipoprotein
MKPNLVKTALICTFTGSLMLAGCGKQTAEEHIMAAEQFTAANNNSAAVLELKNAIQLEPNSAEARFKLGRLYLETNQFESAEKELNRAMELGYSSADVLPLLAKAYRQTGAVNALAGVNHNQASLSAAESAQMGYYKLTALVELEQSDEALLLIEEILELDTQSVYRGLARSYVPIINQDYDTALENAQSARAQAPLNEDVLRLLSKLQLIKQLPEDAVETLAELSKLRPDDVETLFTHLSLLMDLRRFDDAEPIVDSLLELNAENGLLNQFKGMILASQQQHEDALSYLSKALLNGRDNAVVRLLAGYSSYRVADYEGAVANLSLIAEQLPGNHPGLRLLADSQLMLGQSLEASNTLASFEDTSQSDASLFSRAGFGLIQKGDIETARQVVSQGNKIDATAEDLLRLGVLQLSLNDVEGLVKLEQAATESPDSSLTQSTLATAYLLSGEIEKARALAASWKETQPDNFQPYLLAGELALRDEDIDEARLAIMH